MVKAISGKKISYILLVVLAAVMLLSSVSGICYAYFTTYVTAHGGRTLALETEINIREELQDLKKTVYIRNTGSCDCWVRVRAITPPEYKFIYSSDASWVEMQDGYWYFTSQLPVGYETSSPFVITVTDLPKVDGEQPPEFNVAVIAECIPCAGIDEIWSAADWDLQAKGAV